MDVKDLLVVAILSVFLWNDVSGQVTSTSNPTQVESTDVKEIRVGVLLISNSGAPYDLERTGAAVDLALQYANEHILNGSYRFVKFMRSFGPECDASQAPGK